MIEKHEGIPVILCRSCFNRFLCKNDNFVLFFVIWIFEKESLKDSGRQFNPFENIYYVIYIFTTNHNSKQGPVVQSIISLTSSLRGQLLSVL